MQFERYAAAGGAADDMAGTAAGDLPTVLVLDDSAGQRKLVMTLLSRWGYHAIGSGDPAEALEMARDPRVRMIISDWIMPGMDGPEFCRRLRAEGRESYQYVVLLTSKSDTTDLSEGLEAGADDFLTKPLVAPELKARLNAGARIVAMQGELIQKTRSLRNALREIRKLYAALDKELEEARRLQASFLRESHRAWPEAEISLWLRPSGHVGGDMVGFFEASRSLLGFFALDVSGHGVAAAMVVARTAGMLSDVSPNQNIALSPLDNGVFAALPPDLVASRLNQQLLGEVHGERYLTMCLGFLDRRSGVVRFVQAGHPNPLVLRSSGDVELVGAGGLPIGLFPEAQFDCSEIRLAPGDRLLLYSDGLTESPAADGAFLDEEGLIRICKRHAALAGPALIDAISADLERHMGGCDFPDDVSALLIDYRGPQP